MSRIDPIFRDIEIAQIAGLSNEEKSAALAAFASEQIDEARQTNRRSSGADAPYEVIVDGRLGAALSSVRPDGVIVANFDLISTALEWIGEQLILESPRLTGRFMRSWILLADGREIELGQAIPPAEDYAFVNTQPYSRKIDAGLSSQAPNGVVDGIAAVAATRFGNMARVYSTFRELVGPDGPDRQPAIVVKPY